MTRKPYKKYAEARRNVILELIHSDIYGPIELPSLDSKKCFVTFIDDISRFTIIYFLKNKS